MSEQTDKSESRPKSKEAVRAEEFIYKDAGIRERHGYIPAWLWLVAVVLVVWGVYYTLHFWQPPAG